MCGHVSASVAVQPAAIQDRRPQPRWPGFAGSAPAPARRRGLVLLPGLRSRRAPQPVGGALGEAFLIDFDLVADQVEGFGEVRDLSPHAVLVLAEDGEPLLLVAGALPDQAGVLTRWPAAASPTSAA